MSSQKIAESVERKHVPAPVIVRGFQDRPSRLVAVGWRSERVVDVVGRDESDPAGFHAAHVYDFEEGLYGRLRAAAKAEDQATLTTLWGQMSSWAS